MYKKAHSVKKYVDFQGYVDARPVSKNLDVCKHHHSLWIYMYKQPFAVFFLKKKKKMDICVYCVYLKRNTCRVTAAGMDRVSL